MSDIKFVDGLFVKPPHEKAPDFVKGAISIKRKDLGNWLRNETEEWINIDIKVSKDGKWYASVNEWKPDPNAAQPAKEAAQGDDFDDDLPFS